MNRKKKKPKSSSPLMSNSVSMRRAAFRYYNEEMEDITEKFKQRNQNADNTKFHLFQSINSKTKVLDNIFKLAYFYDTNFTGNRDFMHIPNIKQITQNYAKYPTVLATQKDLFGNEEIVGVTTVKMENNKSLKDNLDMLKYVKIGDEKYIKTSKYSPQEYWFRCYNDLL